MMLSGSPPSAAKSGTEAGQRIPAGGDHKRGGLKIFLGAAPGVGKTSAMLLSAQEARDAGRDVVIGVVSSHGRAEIEQLCAGFERIPLARVPFRKRWYSELDLDAVVERRPEIVLIDDVQHRNTRGTRHFRRYQDIEELIERGIEVWTTLNIQYLESLHDVVRRISGVHTYDTVPDKLLENARDIVLIDLMPERLMDRLEQGKVHVPEQVRHALNGFFNPATLTALREMAFVAAANRVDADLHNASQSGYGGRPVPVRERLVIAIDGRRNSKQVVRAGKRLADQRRASWTVVHVETGKVAGSPVRESVEHIFRLAERLGGDTVVLRGASVDAEIVAYARDHNVTTIVVGRPRERPLRGFFHQALTQRLLRHHQDFEVTTIGGAPDEPVSLRGRWKAWLGKLQDSHWHHYPYALAAVAICVAISAALTLLPLALPYLLLIFLTGVLVVAAHTSLMPALVAAVASSLAFNFFFIEPTAGLPTYPVGELVALLLFLVIAIFGSNLANRLRTQVAALRATNYQSQALLALSKQLVEAPEMAAVCRAAVEAIAEFERVPACLMTTDAEPHGFDSVVSAPGDIVLDDEAREAALWTLEHSRSSGYLSETWAGVGWRFIPLVLKETRYGVLGVKFDELPIRPASEQLLLLDALANQVTLNLARTRLTSNLEQAKLAEETERLRAALLSSVSHDLRTPLSSMIGSASTLRDLGDRLSDADKREMLDAVLSEGRRLNRYIENLLDMTRLGYGTVDLQRDWVTLADIMASALQRTREMFVGLHVVRDIHADLPLLYVHPALIEQALVNVLENAARFSSPGDELHIAARQEQGEMLITVTDQGPGIPEADRKRVFEMFFSGGGGDTGQHGSGLGLAICHGMITAHGGTIEALAGPDNRGTTIAIRLPVPELPRAAQA